MNIKYLKELVEEASKIDPQNDVLSTFNMQQRFNEMSKDIGETIMYLDGCSEIELLWATEVLEQLMEHFNSKDLVECVKRNLQRCANKEIKNQLEITLSYMISHKQ